MRCPVHNVLKRLRPDGRRADCRLCTKEAERKRTPGYVSPVTAALHRFARLPRVA